MPNYDLLLIPGDGIGPEVMAEVKKLIGWMNQHGMGTFTTEEGLCGGCAYEAHGVAITDAMVAKAKAADAIIFGSVGGPKWDKVPYEHRPEAGLLRLRKDLQLYANLRPAVTYPALADASSLKRELVEGLDIMILRELTGDIVRSLIQPRGANPAAFQRVGRQIRHGLSKPRLRLTRRVGRDGPSAGEGEKQCSD